MDPATVAFVTLSTVFTGVVGYRVRSARRPPVPKKRPHKVVFGKVAGEDRGAGAMTIPRVRWDPYFWMRDDSRTNPEVLRHLEAEDRYTKHSTKHLKAATDTIYKELLARVVEDDAEPAYPYGDRYWYLSRRMKGKGLPVLCRRDGPDGKEEEVHDPNTIKDYVDGGRLLPNSSHEVLAWSVDSVGNEVYDIHFTNMTTGKSLPDVLKDAYTQYEWGYQDQEVYYVTVSDTFRPHKVWRHVMGTAQSEDVCIYTDDDPKFEVELFKTSDGKFLVVSSQSAVTSECHVVDLSSSKGELRMFAAREFDLQYGQHLEHYDGHFVMHTNAGGATNFKVVSTPVDATARDNWVDLIPYDPDFTVSYMYMHKDFMALHGRRNGFLGIDFVLTKDFWWVNGSKPGGVGPPLIPVPTSGEVFTLYESKNKNYNATSYRYTHSSPISPKSVREHHVVGPKAGTTDVIKVDEVPGYDASKYVCKRVLAKARDGVEIPITVLYSKAASPAADDGRDGESKCPFSAPAPTFLYGYGSYGISIDPTFDSRLLPLCDRGVLYAIAHIRGGGDMGHHWYKNMGKLLNKRNTFTDFIDCAESLVETGWTKRDAIAANGRSAGGLLMGAVLTMRPDLWRCVLAEVAFTDVMNTMCDPSIPLTNIEWDEWGNPNTEEYFDYMLSYSPYDQLKRDSYPTTMITGGLHDPRVAYWECSKMVSAIRDVNTGPNPTYLNMKMKGGGHFSASDRYAMLKNEAFLHAFVLDSIGVEV